MLYLILGHSHKKADCIVAWCKKVIQGLNFFSPNHIVGVCNKVKGVLVEFRDHREVKHPFYTHSGPLLNT